MGSGTATRPKPADTTGQPRRFPQRKPSSPTRTTTDAQAFAPPTKRRGPAGAKLRAGRESARSAAQRRLGHAGIAPHQRKGVAQPERSCAQGARAPGGAAQRRLGHAGIASTNEKAWPSRSEAARRARKRPEAPRSAGWATPGLPPPTKRRGPAGAKLRAGRESARRRRVAQAGPRRDCLHQRKGVAQPERSCAQGAKAPGAPRSAGWATPGLPPPTKRRGSAGAKLRTGRESARSAAQRRLGHAGIASTGPKTGAAPRFREGCAAPAHFL